MALRLPEYRPPAAPQAIPTNVPLNQILAVRGQNPYAQAIDQITPLLSQAFEERAKRKKQLQANEMITKGLGIETPEGADLSTIPTENIIQMANAKTANDKASMFDFVGLSSDRKNAVLLDKRNGTTTLSPLPEGYSPKVMPKDPNAINPNKEEDTWIKLGDKVNSLRQSSRSAVGAAAIANQRADRALQVLADKGASPQQLDYAMTDLAAIFQNGSPHETALNRQQYNTLKTKFINLKTFLTSNPSAANQPEIQQQLKNTVNEIKRVDNKIISDNLGVEGIAFEGLIRRNPDRWKRMTEAVQGTTTGLEPIPVPAQGAAGGMVTIKASDGSMHRLPSSNLDKARQRDPGLQVVQ